jgi:hypothetical protein
VVKRVPQEQVVKRVPQEQEQERGQLLVLVLVPVLSLVELVSRQ